LGWAKNHFGDFRSKVNTITQVFWDGAVDKTAGGEGESITNTRQKAYLKKGKRLVTRGAGGK